VAIENIAAATNSFSPLLTSIGFFVLNMSELVKNKSNSQWYNNQNYICGYTCFLRYRNKNTMIMIKAVNNILGNSEDLVYTNTTHP
jgi:hypothetical protein